MKTLSFVKTLAVLAVILVPGVVNQSAPTAQAQVATPDIMVTGERAFAVCKSCHTLDAGGANGVGPNLHGFFGVKAASRPGFTYSDALKNHNVVWDAKTLDSFLAAPTKAVPGTKMLVKGPTDPQKRQALIAYLKARTQKK